MGDLTELLLAAERGDPRATDRILPLVYEELRAMAAHRLAREAPGHTLDATALVHEAYLRLVGPGDDRRWEGRRHFFGAAAEAMRRILVDSARRRHSLKRGGGQARRDLDPAAAASADPGPDLLALNDALDKLAAADPLAAEVVKLRYFAGLPLADAAHVLGVSTRTAERLWAYARAYLFHELSDDTA